MNLSPLGAELFRADGQTDITKLIVTFLNFANGPNSGSSRSGIGREWTGLIWLGIETGGGLF
jgi:hypothetical protein